MAELFTAVDISSVSTNVSTLMVGLVGVGLLFFGRKVLRRLGFSI